METRSCLVKKLGCIEAATATEFRLVLNLLSFSSLP